MLSGKRLKLRHITELARLNLPAGSLILFFPCCLGVIYHFQTYYDLWYLLLFLVGSFIMHSAGCIINDFIDKDIDAKVARTKNRPFVTGKVTTLEGGLALLLFLSLGLLVLLQLSPLAIVLGFITMIFVVIYPFMKRITPFSQVFLGITHNVGILIAAATLTNTISVPDVMIYIGCIFWVMGCDTIYAFMDIQDDVKIGVKSLAIKLIHKNYKWWLGIFYLLFITFIVLAISYNPKFNMFVFMSGALLALSVLMWQVTTLNIRSEQNCIHRFKKNIIVGFILTLFFFFSSIL